MLLLLAFVIGGFMQKILYVVNSFIMHGPNTLSHILQQPLKMPASSLHFGFHLFGPLAFSSHFSLWLSVSFSIMAYKDFFSLKFGYTLKYLIVGEENNYYF